ncbi:bile acid:sodium symporter family protein [Bacillus sp. 03113]|uniref:bile acid:sodium symporter family protein n=1 Tax=Bacillus sp. 03113 TaxID=2578211 RepID=UPI0011433840|nr:bile acid:sodium symporter family protein [Bacillus sp. 03113]
MLKTLNHHLVKAMPFLTPSSLIIGILIGSQTSHLTFLIPWIFAFMTFVGSLGSNFKQLAVVIQKPIPFLVSLLVLHLLMPLWAWGIGHLVFTDDPLTTTGFILAMVVPTGITSFIWVTIHKGNIAFALSVILIDTLLSPFIVPTSLSLFVGEKVSIDSWDLMKNLILMIVLPSVLGMLLNQLTKGKIKSTLGEKLSPFSKIGIVIIVIINGGLLSPYLNKFDLKVLLIIMTVFIISSMGYLLSWVISGLFHYERDVVVSMTFCGGMRNISAGSVLAVTFFPPAVALPVVLGMLFQQILASFYGQMLHKYYYSKKYKHRFSTQ